MGDRDEVISNFTRWNYGGLTQASEKEDEAGYTEFGDNVRFLSRSKSRRRKGYH